MATAVSGLILVIVKTSYGAASYGAARRNNKSGFALIEVIVALIIMAGVISAMVAITANIARYRQQQHIAQWANNIATRIHANLESALGRTGNVPNLPASLPALTAGLSNTFYAIETIEDDYYRPSNTKSALIHETDSGVLTIRYLNSLWYFEFNGSRWIGDTSTLIEGRYALITTAITSYIARLDNISRGGIELSAITTQNSSIGDRVLLQPILTKRYYIRRNARGQFGLWQQRQHSSVAEKTTNEQIAEHVRYFFVKVGYGENPVAWYDQAKAITNTSEIARALRIAIVISLPYPESLNRGVQTPIPAIMKAIRPAPPGYRYFFYEWVLPLARYRPL